MSPTVWPGAGRADHRTRQAPEKALDARIMDALERLGFFVTRLQQPRRSGVTAGVPDLFAVHVGWRLAVWIELKAKGRKRNMAQDHWHATVQAAGQHVLTVYSVADLVEGLRACGAPLRG